MPTTTTPLGTREPRPLTILRHQARVLALVNEQRALSREFDPAYHRDPDEARWARMRAIDNRLTTIHRALQDLEAAIVMLSRLQWHAMYGANPDAQGDQWRERARDRAQAREDRRYS